MFKPAFNPEPPFTHGQAPRTAVLLCNLGTPDAPTASAVRRYLAEFLGDHRVVEIPRLIWMAILHGIILRVRPAKSAAKYATIWTDEGSPLKVWTDKQAQALQQVFNSHGEAITVRYAMRYGNPSIASRLDELKTTRSDVEDLDYTTAITKMNKDQLAMEAAQSSFAKISQLSLFKYLN